MRAVVVGAGIAGLMAGRTLARAGHEVIVLDKGTSVGGRMATRRIGEATFDHGAQFFTVRTDAFAAHVHGWMQDGVVRVWCRGFDTADGHPRHVGTRGMSGVAKHVASGLDVRCGVTVQSVSRGPDGWRIADREGLSLRADALVVTCPLPQARVLLEGAGVALPEALATLEYDRTLALLVPLPAGRGPFVLPPPGGLQHPDATFSFIGDNGRKGISAAPAITFHAAAAVSEALWDAPAETQLQTLLDAAAPYLGTAVPVGAQVKKWRYAMPRTGWPSPCWASSEGTLVLAGDAFAGAKVEGAAGSGEHAARTLLA